MSMDTTGLKFPKPASRYESKKARKDAEEAERRRVYAAVDKRDGRACRVCGKPSRLEAVGLLDRGHRHHLVYRSDEGLDATWNVCHLCAHCHHEEHQHRIKLSGNADMDKGICLERLTEAGWRVERWI
jgi:5-methylcytosine-specific restriction endonuclease McrA